MLISMLIRMNRKNSSLSVRSFWMKTFPMHFDLDKRLKETCEKMKNLIESSGDIECMKLVDPTQM